MDGFLANQEPVQPEQQRLTRGGVGYSGIAAIVCASVMNKDQSLIDTLTCGKQHQILRQTSMLIKATKYVSC